MGHPPYPPDMAAADFWLFPELRSVLKGNNFSYIEDVRSSVVKQIDRYSCSEF
jgi:hypothetical protein